MGVSLLPHDTAERLRSQGAEQCDQRAYLPGALEFTGGQFCLGVTTYPVSTNTSYVLPNPGVTLYWRLRSSYNQQNWSSYIAQPGAVGSGL